MMTIDFYNSVKKLVSLGKIEEALDSIEVETELKLPDINNGILLLKSRLNSVTKDFGSGQIDFSQKEIIESQIRYSLIGILEECKELFIEEDKFLKEEYDKSEKQKKRILLVGISPRNFSKVPYDIESREIGILLRKKKEKFEFEKEFAITLNLLQEILFEFKPNILHFTGFLVAKKSKKIIFHDKNDEAKKIEIEHFISIMKNFKEIKCIVLNVSNSKELASELSRFFPEVIGWDSWLEDEAALSFSYSFYLGVSNGKNYFESYEMAKASVLIKRSDDKVVGRDIELGSPVYYQKKN